MKQYSPGKIIADQCLHADDLCFGFGTYYHVAEHVELPNSFASCTWVAISLGTDDDGLVVQCDHIDDVLLPVIFPQDDNQIPGVHEEPPVEPSGVDMDPKDVPQETNFDFDDGLEQVSQDTSREHKPTHNPAAEPTGAPA